MDTKRHKPDKRIAILEATLELIAEQGFHNTPTSQIARKASIGVGSIYRYFIDKDDLIQELFLHILKKQNRDMLKGYNPNAPLRERYIHICTNFVQFALQYPNESKFLQQFRHSPYGKKLKPIEMLKKDPEQKAKPPLFVLFETAIAQQVIKELPPFVLGELTFGPLFELVLDINSGLVPNDPTLVQLVVEACWDAIKR